MTTSSSDEWLLALLDEKSPAEFTRAELEALRARASASSDVRHAIAGRIRLEEALHAALGDPQLDALAIRRKSRQRRFGRYGVTGTIAAAILLIAAGTWWWTQKPGLPSVKTAPSPIDVTGRKTGERTDPPQSLRRPIEAPRPQIDAAEPASDIVLAPPATAETDTAPKPWTTTLSDEARVVPLEESAFAPFGDTVPGFEIADEFPAAELERWVESVPGKPFEVNERRWRGKRIAGLEGVARLLPSWRSDAVLRLAPFDVDEFAVHLWSGDQGVTIRFYSHQRPQLLAAYAVGREDADPLPSSYRLIATDSGRYVRSNAGAIEIRHQNDTIVVSRGDVPLLVVPCDRLPTEVLLDGKFRLRTLALYRGTPAKLPQPTLHRSLTGDLSIDQLEWIGSSEPAAHLEKSRERITLTTTDAQDGEKRQLAWAAVRLPAEENGGLCEAVFRLDSLTAGTGLYLGDADGRPVHTLFASHSDRLDAPVLSYGWSDREGRVPEPRWKSDSDPRKELTPAVGAGTWIKLVMGPGGLKTFLSGDGVHWGFAFRSPERKLRGPFATVGVFAMADDRPRSIVISELAIRELSAIASMADATLVRRVPDWRYEPPARVSDWLTWVAATRPNDVASDAWLRACAVGTLHRNASDDVLQNAVEGLAREAVESDRPVTETLAVLHDAALLSDQWRDRSASFAAHYERLGRRIATREMQPDQIASDLVSVAEGYLAAPLWSEEWPWALPPAVVRNLAAAQVWRGEDGTEPPAIPEHRNPSARVASYLTPSHPESGWSTESEAGLTRLVAWAASSSTSSATVTSRRSHRFAWQHPLVTEPVREAQTLAAELDAALDAGAYQDAARLLGTIAELDQLVPAAGDPNRFVTPGGLIAEVAALHPRLVATLIEEFGPVGLLHVRQSIAAGDEAALQAATVRYFGTPAAAEAHRWLGQSDLAAGRFDQAEAHFAAALQSATETATPALAAGRRLAAALAGEDAAKPPESAVTFGSQTLSPAEFERLVDELRRDRTSDSTAPSIRHPDIPKPAAVVALPRGRFEGDVGRNPSRYEFRSIDWVGRQIGMAFEQDTAYLTNRFQIVAFNLERKAPAWSVGLENEQGEAHALPNVAFRPLVRENRLYTRRLLQRGAELACLARDQGGKLLWRSESNLMFASDPVFDAGRLIAVTSASTTRSGGPFTLSLTRLRTDDGTAMASMPLVVLNESRDVKPWAELVATGDGFLIAAAGTILRCDANGQVLWVRRLPYLSASADVDADRLSPDRPMLVGDRVLLAPPGGRAIVCLEAATGRMLWVRPLGELEGLVDVAGAILLARTAGGVLGIEITEGTTAWSLPHDNLLVGTLCDSDVALFTARTPLEDRRDGLSLLRVDAKTGRLLSEQIIRVERKEETRCGPLFVHDGTIWGFVGDGWRDPTRTLVEFAPDDSLPAVGAAADAGVLRPWISATKPQTHLDVATVLPGWTMTGTQPGGGTIFRDEFRGRQWVLCTQDDRKHAACFIQSVDVSAGQKLIAHVGREDDAGWALRLLADGRAVSSQAVNAQTAPEGWRTVTFELSQFAGRTVTLALEQTPPSADTDRTTKAYWKSVEIE